MASLVAVDPRLATMTLRLRDEAHCTVAFRQPDSDEIGTKSKAYDALYTLCKHVGRVVSVEVAFHNVHGWTVFGRRAILIHKS